MSVTTSWIQVGQSDGGTSSNLDKKKRTLNEIGNFLLITSSPSRGKKASVGFKDLEDFEATFLD